MKYFICYDGCNKYFIELTEEQDRLLQWLIAEDLIDTSCIDVEKINDFKLV